MSARFPEQTGREAYRLACLRRLAAVPFTPDRLGMYALRLHEKFPGPLGMLYALDGGNRLVASRVLYSGRTVGAREYCPRLAGLLTALGGSRLAVSVSTAAARTEEDVFSLSRAALYCETNRIPVFEMLLISEGEYYPLLRRSGAESLNI